MEEIQATKSDIRESTLKQLKEMSKETLNGKLAQVETRLFEFANFLEAKIVMLYVDGPGELATGNILKKCFDSSKIIVLPAFDRESFGIDPLKVDSLKKDLKNGPRGVAEPNRDRCKKVPVECIDLAIIPGLAFDEKGARLGTGRGYYDRFIPRLAVTTRKVALTLEEQIQPQIPMESHDKHVDIIITDQRIIYKI